MVMVYGWTSGRVQCTYMSLKICIKRASGIDVLGLFLETDEMALDMKSIAEETKEPSTLITHSMHASTKNTRRVAK